MAVPTFVDIPNTDIDQDSPIDTDLMDAFQDNAPSVRIATFTSDIQLKAQTTGGWGNVELGASMSNSRLKLFTAPLGNVKTENGVDIMYGSFSHDITMWVDPYVDTGTGYVRLRWEGSSTVNGTPVAVTATSSGTFVKVSVTAHTDDYGIWVDALHLDITYDQNGGTAGRIDYAAEWNATGQILF